MNDECRMKNAKPKILKIINRQSSTVNREWGFTLLEVMVAIVILGLGLTVVFELFSGGLKSVEISNDYSNAVILANKKMGELSVKEILKVGKETGDFAGDERYKWDIEIAPYQVEGEGEAVEKESPVKIYQVDVRVFWKAGLTEKDVRLTTLRTFMEKPSEEEKK